MKYRIVEVKKVEDDEEDVKYYIEYKKYFSWNRRWDFSDEGHSASRYHVYSTLNEAKIVLDKIITKRRETQGESKKQNLRIIETIVCKSKNI